MARTFLSRVWKLDSGKLFSDVLSLDFDNVDKVDILWAGWPCQDTSKLAHQNADKQHRQRVCPMGYFAQDPFSKGWLII